MLQSPLLDDADGLKGILKSGYHSTQYFARAFFPDLFYMPFSKLHHQIFELIDSGQRKIVIAAPRGLGKTTIARTVAAKGIFYSDSHLICYISNTATHAERQTENLKRDLLVNKNFTKIRGTIKPDSSVEGLDDTFSKAAWVAYGDSLVVPRGAGQQIRGLLWGKYRPDLVIIDDLEDKEEIRSADTRANLKEWFHSDVTKAINRYDKNWRFIYIDTLKHEDSLLQELLDSPEWASINLSLADMDALAEGRIESVVPEYMTTEELQEELEEHRNRVPSQVHVFYMEYLNIASGGEDAAFRPEYFNYYDETDRQFKMEVEPYLENVILVDPAKSVSKHSDDTAIVGIGLDLDGGAIYIRDVVSGKMHPDEIYSKTFDMVVKLKSHVIGLEVTSLNEFITHPFRNEIVRRRIPVDLVELKPRGNQRKEERVAALEPYYRQGYILHNKACCVGLETQLLAFPRSKRWDIMDATAYIVEMMEIGERYFNRPEEDNMDSEDEYAELDDRRPSLGDWRVV
jgi:hypothetical protein